MASSLLVRGADEDLVERDAVRPGDGEATISAMSSAVIEVAS